MNLNRYRAAAGGRRQGFALRDLVATICCVAVLFALGCPWMVNTTNGHRRNGCLNNIRQLGLSIANFEAATQRFPLASDAPAALNAIPPGTVGEERGESAGYSWLVQILPFIEQNAIFQEAEIASDEWTLSPFDTSVTRAGSDVHVATVQQIAYRCPSYRGDVYVETAYGSEYDSLLLMGGAPAVSNYVALVGTHVNADGTINENGVIVSKCARPEDECQGKGLELQDIQDGISTTIIACETVEPIYSAWIDGQATWVVPIHPVGVSGVDTPTPTATQTLLNVGADPMDENDAYSAIGLYGDKGWPSKIPRHWGPSSHHNGNVILHVYADAHAQAISPDVDATVYYRLITRNGADLAEPDKL